MNPLKKKRFLHRVRIFRLFHQSGPRNTAGRHHPQTDGNAVVAAPVAKDRNVLEGARDAVRYTTPCFSSDSPKALLLPLSVFAKPTAC